MRTDTSEVQGIHSYLGNDFVMVGNGNGLQISGIGQVSLPATDIKLNNVLVVPDIKKNCYLSLNLQRSITVISYFILGAFFLRT